MAKLTHQPNLEKSITNLEEFMHISNNNTLNFHLKSLRINKQTSSDKLNNYINKYAVNFQKKIEFIISEAEKRNTSLSSALKTITSPSNQELTYKGVNLGSAIHMKLAVTISQLLKNK